MTDNKKIYIETYGCQMNFSDTEIILGILDENGYEITEDVNSSDIIFLNTCSVRENAEKKIFKRLNELKKIKTRKKDLIVGILGCTAERLKNDLLEKYDIVDLIIGPDEYRKVPALLKNRRETGEKGIAVVLSEMETYDDILPFRKNGVTAFISVMRGCNNFCSYCIVPFTRGRERSRNAGTIVREAEELVRSGVKDIWLLGQNVNSYRCEGIDFPELLKIIAGKLPGVRIRFITSHPYDLSDKLLEIMAEHKNICKYIHLPLQSGSDKILKVMNRLYSAADYLRIIQRARNIMPDVGLSTDIICGFPGETDDDHKKTLDLLNEIKFDSAFTFAYSPRENTEAFELGDSIPSEIKSERLKEIIQLQRNISLEVHNKMLGKILNVLFESRSKRSDKQLMGRTDCNKSVIIEKGKYEIGDFLDVKIEKVNSATLFGKVTGITND
ncbi:MAG: tRNA (N6-isopentenyl adenosine(37)-C2)-methylthiotransferase MiaB [Ignavibacteria bacterium]|nr:tRNA (N6-isopentenyl adenosine(37)-C2)-methylthiotransferase MiaB [Ignavibacteria bacterium]